MDKKSTHKMRIDEKVHIKNSKISYLSFILSFTLNVSYVSFVKRAPVFHIHQLLSVNSLKNVIKNLWQLYLFVCVKFFFQVALVNSINATCNE